MRSLVGSSIIIVKLLFLKLKQNLALVTSLSKVVTIWVKKLSLALNFWNTYKHSKQIIKINKLIKNSTYSTKIEIKKKRNYNK